LHQIASDRIEEGGILLSAPATQAPVKHRTIRRYFKRWEHPFVGYAFLTPWLIGFFGLTLGPMIMSVYYAFTDYSLLEKANWVGLSNFSRILLGDSTFGKSLNVTLLFVVLSVPLKLMFALAVAMLLNKELRGMSLYRLFIYFPSLIGASLAVAVLWQRIWSRDGFINEILGIFGIQGMNWVNDPRTALGTLVILVVWQFGSSMVIFLAGLKQIPREYYEASSVDGSGKVRQFFMITLPLLSPIILFNLVLQTINSFQMFTQAFVITEGGPMQSTYMYTLYLYDRAFGRLQMGYASALAWIMLLVIAAATALIFLSSKFWVFYENEGRKSK
jgi:multiple sugar transport system permease protein